MSDYVSACLFVGLFPLIYVLELSGGVLAGVLAGGFRSLRIVCLL